MATWPVCFSEKASKPLSKAAALPRHGTAAGVLGQPGFEQLATQSRTKTARRSRVALKICSIRGRDVDDGRHNTAAQMFMASRATAAFAFIGRGYCPRQACGRKSMRLGMAMYTQIGGLGSRSRERRSGSCWPYFVAGMGCGVMGACFGSRADALQIFSHCGCLKGARTARAISTSRSVLAAALVWRSVFASLPSPSGSSRAFPTCLRWLWHALGSVWRRGMGVTVT